ncbi:DUF1801 domain-containing protein [Microbacterium sp. HD4P20]|uniref:iron chaperone n=1 Tax=Microbacterium sp. HD4P20 TaxID=2864874 RepID=UPI001C641517|nr:DUF1801 domain-containing protein [Microbacterium sp. HD4P20]MCP2637443.1 DUF1801 domain-containing protein [Microbacterium sp. HD4P20]
MSTEKASTPDEFFAALPEEAKSELERLRTVIRAAAPDAAEGLGYGIPTYRVNGKPLVSLGVAAKHLSLYVMDTDFARTHADRLSAYDTAGGAIRFTPAHSLPTELVEWVVAQRLNDLRAT